MFFIRPYAPKILMGANTCEDWSGGSAADELTAADEVYTVEHIFAGFFHHFNRNPVLTGQVAVSIGFHTDPLEGFAQSLAATLSVRVIRCLAEGSILGPEIYTFSRGVTVTHPATLSVAPADWLFVAREEVFDPARACPFWAEMRLRIGSIPADADPGAYLTGSYAASIGFGNGPPPFPPSSQG